MAQETVNFERWKYIGGSDIPIIMNLSPFKTRWKLLREKAQIEEDEFQGNIYTEYGNVMEPKIREYLNESLGFDFVEGKAYGEGVRIHTDGEDVIKDTILEIKTTSHIYDEVTDYKLYLVQLLFYMMERRMRFGILAVYERPEDLSTDFDWERLMTYPIVVDDYLDLVSEIYAEVYEFRKDLEKLKQNPFLTEEDLLPEDIRMLSKRLVNAKERESLFKDMKAERELIEAKLGELLTEAKKTSANVQGYKVTFTPPREGRMKEVQEVDFEKLKTCRYSKWIYKNCVRTEQKLVGASKGKFTITKQKEVEE